jgi:hypothetical protein
MDEQVFSKIVCFLLILLAVFFLVSIYDDLVGWSKIMYNSYTSGSIFPMMDFSDKTCKKTGSIICKCKFKEILEMV